ncbi:cytochrome c [Altererythrobacter sp. KTW20L]|uniref:c-type cytochrome n=1 Tax=Altererythrobacter sp. KTW20L TaxID=2942210 RepID=UPI0020C10D1D|nr:cytochrome c [Altererythrobacter sp. KTW20L]MCL6250342.1 cytochrome c [Altererythrobacter sp. KTW20L]
MSRTVAFTALAGLVLAGCAGVAVAQNAPDALQDVAPATPPPAGPPPGMPQPITMAKRPAATGGEALYIEHCMVCHGPNGMGTGLLERAGRPEPLLEMRSGLPAAFYVTAARNGIGNMPSIPRGEVSDEQMQAIAEYLAAGPHGVAP